MTGQDKKSIQTLEEVISKAMKVKPPKDWQEVEEKQKDPKKGRPKSPGAKPKKKR